MNLLNRQFFVIIVFILVGFNPIMGQNNTLDSLEKIIANPIDSYGKANSYFTLAKYYRKSTPEKALNYLEKSYKFFKKNNFDSLSIKVLEYEAYIYINIDRGKAIGKFFEALTIARKTNQIQIKSSILHNIGRVYLLENNLDSGVFYTNKAIKLRKKLLEEHPEDALYIRYYAKSLMNLGTLYTNSGKYEEAISTYYQALEQIEKIQDSTVLVSILRNIGTVHFYYKDYNTALKEFKRCYTIAQRTNSLTAMASALTNMGAIYKYQKLWFKADSVFNIALSIRLKTGPQTSVAGLYQNLGIVSAQQEKYNEALNYYNKSLEILIKRNNPTELTGLYINMGNVYHLKKDYAKAEKYLLLGKENADLAKMPEISMWLNLNLSKLYESMGNYPKALSYYKEYKLIDDSIHSLKAAETINLLKEKYNAAEKDREIADFEKQKKLDSLIKEKQSLNNTILTIGIIAIIITSLFIFVLLNNRRKAERAIFQKNTELNQQKMLELVKEQEMNSVNSFISGQERERSRIASDLHDRLGSLLSTVKLHFSSIEPYFENDKDLSENFNYAITLLDKSVAEVRSVSHNLAKEILTEFGIIAAIENLKEAINTAGNLRLEFVNSGFDHRLPYESEIEIYRIIQELVTNAIKHAKASEIVIQFIVDDDNLTITIEDDGVGFDAKNIKDNGMGLKNVFERATKINGKYALDTSPGNGTTYIFDIPIGQSNQ